MMKSKPKARPAPIALGNCSTLGDMLNAMQAGPPPATVSAKEQAEIDALVAELSKDPGFFIFKP